MRIGYFQHSSISEDTHIALKALIINNKMVNLESFKSDEVDYFCETYIIPFLNVHELILAINYLTIKEADILKALIDRDGGIVFLCGNPNKGIYCNNNNHYNKCNELYNAICKKSGDNEPQNITQEKANNICFVPITNSVTKVQVRFDNTPEAKGQIDKFHEMIGFKPVKDKEDDEQKPEVVKPKVINKSLTNKSITICITAVSALCTLGAYGFRDKLKEYSILKNITGAKILIAGSILTAAVAALGCYFEGRK